MECFLLCRGSWYADCHIAVVLYSDSYCRCVDYTFHQEVTLNCERLREREGERRRGREGEMEGREGEGERKRGEGRESG